DLLAAGGQVAADGPVEAVNGSVGPAPANMSLIQPVDRVYTAAVLPPGENLMITWKRKSMTGLSPSAEPQISERTRADATDAESSVLANDPTFTSCLGNH